MSKDVYPRAVVLKSKLEELMKDTVLKKLSIRDQQELVMLIDEFRNITQELENAKHPRVTELRNYLVDIENRSESHLSSIFRWIKKDAPDNSADTRSLLRERSVMVSSINMVDGILENGAGTLLKIKSQNFAFTKMRAKLDEIVSLAGLTGSLSTSIERRQIMDRFLLKICMALTILVFFVLLWFR